MERKRLVVTNAALCFVLLWCFFQLLKQYFSNYILLWMGIFLQQIQYLLMISGILKRIYKLAKGTLCPMIQMIFSLGPDILTKFQSTSLSVHPSHTTTACLWRSCGSVKGLIELQAHSIHCSSFLYQATHFIIEVYQVAQACFSLKPCKELMSSTCQEMVSRISCSFTFSWAG